MTPSRTAAAEKSGRSTTRRRTATLGNGVARAAARDGRGRPPRVAASANGKAKRAAAAAGTARSPIRGETPKARGERTRQRVAEALIELLDEGDPTPTAKSVATRAGVSVRLVFHHFEDMEALYKMVLTVQEDRHWSAVRDVPAELPLDERIERTVAQRAKLFDAIGSVRRATAALAARRDDVAEAIANGDGLLRSWLQSTFATELDRAGRERRDVLDAVDAAASWEAWDRLRRSQSLSAPAARRVTTKTLSALLSR